MIPVSLCVCLHLGVNSSRAFSLPQSRLCILWARQLCPLAVLRSCFGYSLSHLRTAAACLSRCIRHRRRSKAKPLRGSRGGYRRTPQNCLCVTTPSKCARTTRTPKTFAPKGQIFHTRGARISPCRRRDFTRQQRCRISPRRFAAQSAAIPFSIAYLSLN